MHAREYFVCASAGEAERERGEAGKRAFAWWEVDALMSTGTCGRQFRVNFLIQLPFERASLDSFSGMEVGHWSLMHWGCSPDFFQTERAPSFVMLGLGHVAVVQVHQATLQSGVHATVLHRV